MTGLDAAFLSLETPSNHMHLIMVAVLDPTEVPGGFTAETMKRLIEQRIDTLPPFRRRVVRVPFGLHHPLWIEDPGFDLDFHVRQVAVPSPGGERELAAFVGEVAGWPLDRDRPLWQMWVVEGLEHGHVALVAKVHHAAVDGASGVEVLASLVDLEPTPVPATIADRGAVARGSRPERRRDDQRRRSCRSPANRCAWRERSCTSASRWRGSARACATKTCTPACRSPRRG